MTLWLVVLLPISGAVVLAVAGGRLTRRLHGVIGAGSIALSFGAVLSMATAGRGEGLRATLGPWLPIAGGDLALAIDRTGMPLALMVTGVAALIAVYSIGYLGTDSGTQRYFATLDLFVAAMLLIVLGANLAVVFAGWELVGLCSYLLIGHWRERPAAAAAAVKAFVVNRAGDAAFLVGLFAILAERRTLALDDLGGLSILTSALLLCGALAKSAQFPLHIWLPDAMEGPTPVSALIHAATMVTAGVVLLLRLGGALAPEVLAAAAGLGAFTALGAALAALAQTDLKRVLAWSTISQLGLMFVGAGIGAVFATLFHLLAHAFFKATLFLGAGSVMHATGNEQDLRRLGALGPRLRWTAPAFAAGALGLAALPPASGFFSKEAIAAAALDRPLLAVAVLATGALSALYAARLFALVFVAPAGSAVIRGAHESPRLMLVPLVALALPALGFGALVAVGGISLGVPATEGAPLALTLGAAGLALAGAGLGLLRYRRGPFELLPAGFGRAALAGFGADRALVRGGSWLVGTIAAALDRGVEATLQWSLDAVGRLILRTGARSQRLESGFVRSYEAYLLAGAVLLLAWWSLGVGTGAAR
ncbi:MAG: NADH-quinone oxidoreductase subunit L [Chloroflexi bacterium]|nr:NADH-quinone oxidoreductase subunit L [Chloroflexota bacterium]